ncbi:MAG TPA: histidine triad nucleotide-binding protein [Spirochaetota bacterium]|nr:histidine triad nucleotide-binding protein [Spirochaetota bacterium]HRZ28351.1 histidine triad nucleotide-binding protein [Spirochaetota bacterium]
MMDCIFCKIISGEIPSEKVYENASVYAFSDIHPLTPVHVLVVPKVHIKNIDDISEENGRVMSDLFAAVNEIAAMKGLREKGYRVIINNGKAAGQEVFHLHMHILGGKEDLGGMLA